VRRSNSHAISLYQKMNFHLVGERKEYYPTLSGYEDALVFAKRLVEHSSDFL
jgi:ribosomal-protein-alanine N-acetyltransferase